MLNGMSTIEMIQNLKIENLTENRVIRRFGWPPTMCNAMNIVIHLQLIFIKQHHSQIKYYLVFLAEN